MANGTTNWMPQVPYYVNQMITGTCNESYLVDMTSNTQDIYCTPSGWEEFSPCYEGKVLYLLSVATDGIKYFEFELCYEASAIEIIVVIVIDIFLIILACVDPPPVPGENMTMTNFTWNGIGAVLNYTCDEGTMIPTNEVRAVAGPSQF